MRRRIFDDPIDPINELSGNELEDILDAQEDDTVDETTDESIYIKSLNKELKEKRKIKEIEKIEKEKRFYFTCINYATLIPMDFVFWSRMAQWTWFQARFKEIFYMVNDLVSDEKRQEIIEKHNSMKEEHRMAVEAVQEGVCPHDFTTDFVSINRELYHKIFATSTIDLELY